MIISAIVLIILSLILQSTLFNHLMVGNVKPDLVLVISISIALTTNARTGMAIAFFGGLLHDLAYGYIIGCHAFAKMSAIFFVKLLERSFIKENLLVPMILVAIGTFINGLVCYSIIAVATGEFSVYMMLSKLVIESCYNAIITPIVLWLIRRPIFAFTGEQR